MKRMLKNNDGQTSLDFLIGITLFLLVFIFVFAFIPKMFTPFQTDSDELTMAADRAAVALVENILVDNRHFDSGHTPAVYTGADTPGIVSMQKYLDLYNKIDTHGTSYSETNVQNVKKDLGLGYQKSFGASAAMSTEQYYNLEIELVPVSTIDLSLPSLIILPDIETTGTNVGQSKRFVYVANDDTPVDYTMAILTVRVW